MKGASSILIVTLNTDFHAKDERFIEVVYSYADESDPLAFAVHNKQESTIFYIVRATGTIKVIEKTRDNEIVECPNFEL